MGLFLSLCLSRKKYKVYLLDSVDFFDANTKEITVLEKIINLLFPKRVKIFRVPFYGDELKIKTDDQICWTSNQETLSFLESNSFLMKINHLEKLFISLIPNNAFILSMKKLLMPLVFHKILFYNQYFALKQRGISIDKIYATKKDFLDIFLFKEIEQNSDLVDLRLVDKLAEFFYYLLFLPSPFFLKNIIRRRFKLVKPKVKSFDFATQSIWGFGESYESDEVTLKKAINDTEILDNEYLSKVSTIFFSGKFQKSLINDKNSDERAILQKFGAIKVNEKKLTLHIGLLSTYIKLIVNISFRVLFSGVLNKNVSLGFLIPLHRIVGIAIDQEIMLSHFCIKVFMSKDDYDCEHIIRTCMQNKYGNINTGLQHSAFLKPNLIPNMAYSYFDRYYLQGSKFKELWSPYFNSNKTCISAGTQRDHLIKLARKDKDISIKFSEKYRNKISILMLITSFSGISPPELLKNKYKGFLDLLELHQDIVLILKPRQLNTVNDWLTIFPELNHWIKVGRVFVEDSDFTTQELIAYSDILIAEDSSSVILEAIHFDNLMITSLNVRYPYNELLRGLLFEDMNNLKLAIKDYIQTREPCSLALETKKIIQKNFTMGLDESSWSRVARDMASYIRTNP